MRSRGHSPDRVCLSAIVLRFRQQVMRSTLSSGKVCFSLSASRFCPTTRLRRHSSASLSRYSIISGILYAVSMCTSGIGTWPKKALRARCSSTVLSLPIDHSMQTLPSER